MSISANLQNQITRYQTLNLIHTWNNSNRTVLHEITEDGIINVEGAIDLYRISDGWKAISQNGGTLTVNFGVCESFFASRMRLKSMVGCPKIVCDSFNVSQNSITTLEGLPSYARVVDLRNNPIKSFEGIGNLKECEEIWLPNSIKSNLLGILKIKTLKRLYCDANFTNNSRFHLVFTILKRHLQSNRNILACQEELMDNGLKEYAKI